MMLRNRDRLFRLHFLPHFDGLDATQLRGPLTDNLSWDFVKRLRDVTTMKVVLKGIVTAEDAAIALPYGVDGLLVSNHGGRSEERLGSTIEALPEVVEAVGGRVPTMIDSGFRRGSDIFKALALGANAVGIGRPYVWGLAAFGQEESNECSISCAPNSRLRCARWARQTSRTCAAAT